MIPGAVLPFAILLVLLVAFGIYEFRSHHIRLSYIPTRVHVNGTRGKSSVTRLIYGALMESGLRVVGKTTGTHPRYLDSLGVEHEIPRVGKPNIKEQILTTRRAFQEGANAIVFECMALQPEIQALSEDKILRATVGVITNVRPDHLDVMGPTLADVARTLAMTVPSRGVLFTAESDPASLEILEKTARKRGTRLVRVDPGDVIEADLSGFSYFEHSENVALALAVAGHLGVERKIALRGMWGVNPDAGALQLFDADFGGRRIRLVNAFASNDPASIRLIFDRLHLSATGGRILLVVYCRGDRIQRSEQMAELLAGGIPYDVALVVGRETRVATTRAIRLGADPEKVVSLEGLPIEPVMERIVALAGEEATVVGIGNIVGLAEEIVERFQNREEAHVLHRSDWPRARHQPHLL